MAGMVQTDDSALGHCTYFLDDVTHITNLSVSIYGGRRPSIFLREAPPRELSLDCSCPDHAVPCKHLAATFYLLAESFDDDPLAIPAWRG
jgi:hypothetical protein